MVKPVAVKNHSGIRQDRASLSGVAGRWIVLIKGGDLCSILFMGQGDLA